MGRWVEPSCCPRGGSLESLYGGYNSTRQTVRIRRVNVIVFVVIAYVVHGYQPHVGASADALLAFTEESQCILYAKLRESGNATTRPGERAACRQHRIQQPVPGYARSRGVKSSRRFSLSRAQRVVPVPIRPSSSSMSAPPSCAGRGPWMATRSRAWRSSWTTSRG